MNPTGRDTSSTTETAIRVQMNYSVPMDRMPSITLTGDDLSLETVEVSVALGHTLQVAPRLDVEGFVCIPHKAPIADLITSLTESEAAKSAYRDAIGALMRDVTGADEIVMLPLLGVRRQKRPADGGQSGPTVEYVHSDFTYVGAVQALDHYGPPPLEGASRTAMYNVWRLISPGPTNRPLALCDARSVSDADIIVGESRYPFSTFETSFIRHRPDHRWVYYPHLSDEEVLIFKQADSDATLSRIVPHTAFADPSCPADPVPRVSVEARCLAIWRS